MSQQRTLIITRNLPPLVGGMERLNWHMADELSKYAKVAVIAPKGSKALKPQNVDLIEVPLKPLPLFILLAFLKGFYLTLKTKPNTILAGSGLTAPLAWMLSKLGNAKSVAYLHGLDITVENNLYQLLWRRSFKQLDSVIVNSTPTKQLAIAAGIKEEKITIVHPGVTLPEKPQPTEAIESFKREQQLEDKKILLSVGRLTNRKGLREFVAQSLPFIVKENPNTVLLVIGDAPTNALGIEIQTIESIKAAAYEQGLEKNIIFLGSVDEITLLNAYAAADLHVFPIRELPGNPEGFGMVAIEAATYGTPTIAFSSGGIIDAVKQGESGYLIEKGNYQAFAEQTVKLLNNPLPEQPIKQFSQQFAWIHFGKAVYQSL